MQKIKEYWDIRVHLLGLIFAFPLLKFNHISYIIIAWSLFSFFYTLLYEKELLKQRIVANFKIVLVMILLFALFSGSLFYTQELSEGIKKLTQSLALIIFPIVAFFLNRGFTFTTIRKLEFIFVIACLLQTFYLHVVFFNEGLYSSFIAAKFYELPFREVVFNLDFQPLHPTYITLWYSLCIIIIIFRLRKVKVFSLKTAFYLLSIGVFLVTIVLMSSRIGIVSIVAVLFLNLLMLKSKKAKYGLAIVLFVVAFFSIKNISFLSSRFIEELKTTEIKPPVGKAHNSINLRVGIYQCGYTIFKQNPLFGVGVGDVQKHLDSCYEKYDTNAYELDLYNSHNYYLHILLSLGIIGLLLFLTQYWIFVKIALRYNDRLYLSFLVLIAFGMVAENLSRNHGVLFFALFNSVFLKLYEKNNANCFFGNIS